MESTPHANAAFLDSLRIDDQCCVQAGRRLS